MDKVLAFSILSASPADISAGAGFDGSWAARLSWRSGADDQQAAGAGAAAQQREEHKEKRGSSRCGSRSSDGGEHARGGGRPSAAAPRFAPEFDGIDCFETIVSH